MARLRLQILPCPEILGTEILSRGHLQNEIFRSPLFHDPQSCWILIFRWAHPICFDHRTPFWISEILCWQPKHGWYKCGKEKNYDPFRIHCCAERVVPLVPHNIVNATGSRRIYEWESADVSSAGRSLCSFRPGRRDGRIRAILILNLLTIWFWATHLL